MLFVQFMLRYIYLLFPNLKSAKRRALCVQFMCVCSLYTEDSPQCKEARPIPVYTHTLFILPSLLRTHTHQCPLRSMSSFFSEVLSAPAVLLPYYI